MEHKTISAFPNNLDWMSEEKKMGKGQQKIALTAQWISFHIFPHIVALSFPKRQITREWRVERFHTCVKQCMEKGQAAQEKFSKHSCVQARY